MNEIVTIGIGNAGCNITDQIFDQLAKEHTIDPSTGFIKQPEHNNSNIFFLEKNSDKSHQPRCVLIDLEPDTINSISKRSRISRLYNKDFFVNGKEASATYSNAVVQYKQNLRDKCDEIIRKQIEKCDYLQGINVHFSLLAGSSGASVEIINRLECDYGKIPIFLFYENIGDCSQATVPELYNTMLSWYAILNTSHSAGFYYDNKALYKALEKISDYEDNYHNRYERVNKLLALQFSDLFSGMRFGNGFGIESMQHVLANQHQFINSYCTFMSPLKNEEDIL